MALIVGIFPGSDAQALESALTAQNVDLSKIKVVSMTPPNPDDEDCQLEFVDVIEDMELNSLSDEMTHGTGIIPDSGGTGVPGVTSVNAPEPTLDSFTHHEGATRAYLKGYAIPDDEVDNFGDAVAEGRSVVLYVDGGSDAVAAAFKAAGLRNVRAY